MSSSNIQMSDPKGVTTIKPTNGAEVLAKYESLKTKYRIFEGTAADANNRALKAEEEVK